MVWSVRQLRLGAAGLCHSGSVSLGSLTSIRKSGEEVIAALTQSWNTLAALPARSGGTMSSHSHTMNLICSSCSIRERRTSCGEFSPCYLSPSTGDTIWRWGPLFFLFSPFLKRKIWLSRELPNQHKKMGLLSSSLCLQLVLVSSLLDTHMYLIPSCAGCLLKEQICKWGGSLLPCQWKWNT